MELNNINLANGYVNKGNLYRIKRVFEKARAGKNVNIAFIGGSITQGCLATVHEKSYSYLTYKWWCEKFSSCKAEYINAGIGGTTSQYGVARVEEDVLSKNPDLVFIEFSVNDENSAFFKETYESLVRRILKYKTKPAVILIHNIKYDDGANAYEIHSEIGKHYDLPAVSMIPTLYKAVQNGDIKSLDITEDNLHPNDLGHKLVSEIIISALENMDGNEEGFEDKDLPEALTLNAYENSSCVRSSDDNANVKINAEGFERDLESKNYYTDIFKSGWKAKNKGDKIEFLVEATGIAVQYRKTINKPAPIARLSLFDMQGTRLDSLVLDGNFTESWGDELHLDNVLVHGENQQYKVVIEIIEASDDDKSDFYLNALIVS